MDKVLVGKLIKERRKAEKCTQEDLCLGICSVTSLSRIENGNAGTRESNYIPSLFERLGMSADSIDEIKSEDDYSVRQMIRQANQADVLGDRAEAWRIVRETRERIDKSTNDISLANEQRLSVLETQLYRGDNKISVEEELKRLEKALRMTAVNYSHDNLPQYMTNMECQILSEIAIAYSKLGQLETAIAIDSHVKEFEEFYIEDKIVAANNLTILCYNLSKMYGLVGKYSECVAVARDGINWHKFTGIQSTLPLTMYNCAWSLARRNEFGDIAEAKKLAYESLEITNFLSKYDQVSPTLAGSIQRLIDEYHL